MVHALDIFGDKWSLVVVRELLLNGPRSYGDLIKIEEGISTNILASRLKNLTGHGVLLKEKKVGGQDSFSIYKLTKKGFDLSSIIFEMIKWSGTYDANPDRNSCIVDRVRYDENGLLEEISDLWEKFQ